MKILLSFVLCFPMFAANWYVRSGASGDGTSWASAWSNTTGIVWASVNPGDTVWIAGGSYGALTLGKSGNADSAAGRIFVKRATTSAHGSDTDWSAGYDAQVSLSLIQWDTINVGSYVTVDGQVAGGIRITHADGDGVRGIDIARGNSYITLRYVETIGPGDAGSYNHTGDNRGLKAIAWNGSTFEDIDYLKVQYSKFHGACTQVFAIKVNHSIWENNEFYNSNSTTNTYCHVNIFATESSTDVTFRYNRIYNYAAEGIMILQPTGYGLGAYGALYVYGNLWYAPTESARAVETQDGVNGPLYFYNNTLNGLALGVRSANGGTWASGSVSRNNIWWNMTQESLADTNYELCSGTCTGANSVSNASDPFVNVATHDYRLASGSVAAVGAGANLGSPYDVDFAGAVRGSVFDIGAYEYAAESSEPLSKLRSGTFRGVTIR